MAADSPRLRSALAAALPGGVLREVLAEGPGGVVLLVERPDGRVVVKCLPHPRGRHRHADREAAMLRAAQGRHVVRLEEVAVADGFTFLVMEHLSAPSLRARLADTWSAPDLAASALGVTSALARMHRAGLLFNDLKLRNAGVTPAQRLVGGPATSAAGDSVDVPGEVGRSALVVKLLDFGHARTIDDTRAQGFVAGSVDYVPPEVVRAGVVGPSSDVWAWGRSWHLLASGDYFGRFADFNDLLRRGRPPLPPIAAVSRTALPTALAALIDDAVAPDQQRRPADGVELHERLSEAIRAEWGPDLPHASRYVPDEGRTWPTPSADRGGPSTTLVSPPRPPPDAAR